MRPRVFQHTFGLTHGLRRTATTLIRLDAFDLWKNRAARR